MDLLLIQISDLDTIDHLVLFFKQGYPNIAYLVTLVVAINTYRKYYDTLLKYFAVLIAYTLFNEILGYLIRYYPDFSFFTDLPNNTFNDIIYNIYDLIFFGYFYYIYWNLTKSKAFKKSVMIGAIVALSSYIINAIVFDPFLFSLFYANAIASWILVLCITQYFIELGSNFDWKSQRYNLMLWVSLGLITFNFFFPFFFVSAYRMPDAWQNYNPMDMIRILIILMYFLFCYGFIVSRKRLFQ